MEFDLGIWDIENYMLGEKISRNSFFFFPGDFFKNIPDHDTLYKYFIFFSPTPEAK